MRRRCTTKIKTDKNNYWINVKNLVRKENIMKKLLFIFLTVLAIITIIVSGCGKATTSTTPVKTNTTVVPASTPTSTVAAQDGGTLRIIATEGPSGSLGIPEKYSGFPGFNASIIETLFITGPNGEVQNILGTGYKWSADYKTLTINLRKGVKFHDGSDFNADVVISNFDRLKAAGVDGTENMGSYSKVDDYTVQINLKEYQNTWFARLGQTMGTMISTDSLDKMGVDYLNYHPVGTGPFTFKNYKQNEYLEVQRFDGYWGGKAHLDGIKYIFIADAVTAELAFQSGQGDVISTMSGAAKMANELTAKGFVLQSNSEGNAMSLIPSVTDSNDPLANPLVRKAIEYAIDKAKIAKTVGLGYSTPIYQYAAPGQNVYDPNFQGRVYDLDKARELLKEAGYPNGFSTILYCGTHLADDSLTLIQANLKEVNINVEIQLVSIAKWIDMETNGWTGGFLASPTTLSTGYGDTILRYLIAPSGPNWSRGIYWNSLYRSDKLESLIQQYLVSPSVDDQVKIGKEIVQEIYDNACAIPLWESKDIVIVTNKVHDRVLDSLPHNWNFTACWLSK